MKKGTIVTASNILLGMSFLLASGCTTQNKTVLNYKPAPTPVAKANGWVQRQQTLAQRQAWSVNGRVSVTYRNENWPFSIVWRQQNANAYTMTVIHPITRARMAVITRDLGGVRLQSSDGKTYTDTSAERLVARHLNIQIPVEGMQYWVRGLPAPLYSVDAVDTDSLGRPKRIVQAGWSISLSSYNANRYDAMPGRITVERKSPEVVRVKMRAKQWQ